jgi:hypothetical protein
MPDKMGAIKAQVEELAEHLAALMMAHADNPSVRLEVNGLRNAHILARRALEIIRRSEPTELKVALHPSEPSVGQGLLPSQRGH